MRCVPALSDHAASPTDVARMTTRRSVSEIDARARSESALSGPFRWRDAQVFA